MSLKRGSTRRNGSAIGYENRTSKTGSATGVWQLDEVYAKSLITDAWPEAPATVTDPSFNNVRLLMPFGTNANDVSNNSVVPSYTSIGGSSVYSSGKFGNGWQHQQGMVTYSDGNTWGSTSDGDYWIFEAWIRRTGNTWRGSSGNEVTGLLWFGAMELRGAGTSLYWYDSDDGTASGIATLASTTTQNQWYHVLVHRSVSSIIESFYFYLDGVNKGLKQFIISSHTQPVTFRIGTGTNAAVFDVDDIRLTENANRHSISAGSNFTPPATPHPTQ